MVAGGGGVCGEGVHCEERQAGLTFPKRPSLEDSFVKNRNESRMARTSKVTNLDSLINDPEIRVQRVRCLSLALNPSSAVC